MKDSTKLMLLAAKIQYRIRANDKKPRSYGTRHLLYQSEIHFIDAIEPGAGLNASELAKKLGISSGAITQMAARLMKKKLIEKYRIEGNKKEVYLKLTSDGETAFANHRFLHRELSEKLIGYLDELTREQMEALFGLIEIIDKNLQDFDGES
jgi:DNA-binding MarR family transcriptional regulator